MSADGGHGGGGRGRKKRGDHFEHPDERWLLTYADMITLLMALFIVMWSMSTVNISKFSALKDSLHEAFNGEVVEGGTGVLDGGNQVLEPNGARVKPVVTPREQTEASAAELAKAAAEAETASLRELARKVNEYAHAHQLDKRIQTKIDERGLIVSLLTDKVLFDSGAAVVKPGAVPVIREIAHLIRRVHIENPIRVEGNTDSRPIHTAQFRSNWELSTGRATAVLQVLLAGGVNPNQLSAAGYADQRPVASNATAAGRDRNRHVDIVVLRNGGVERGIVPNFAPTPARKTGDH
jgi:chemotaxis protein MotB